ncbi:MAG TPA: hypothetical protein DEQ45_10530, partial [Agrobacterium sp.]|nr:hypothetical protein [Agrobacterium sp.]
PPGYVGYDEGGQLTEKVRRRPYCVILLDEIEKAHADVYNVLLQVFDDGRLTDGKGRVVDFSNTLIIATSNLASDVIMGGRQAPGFQATPAQKGVREGVMVVLRQHFRPEFLNRIDEIIIFDSLNEAEIRQIVGLQLDRVRRMAEAQDIALVFDDTVVDHLAKEGYQPEYGARELKRQIRQLIETKLARAMLKGDVKEGNRVVCTFDAGKGEVAFSVEQADSGAQDGGDAAVEPGKPAKRAAKKAPKATKADRKRHADELLDEALEETFPASDALSVTRDRPLDGD